MSFNSGFQKVSMDKEAFLQPLLRAGLTVARPLARGIAGVGKKVMRPVSSVLGGTPGIVLTGAQFAGDTKSFTDKMNVAGAR